MKLKEIVSIYKILGDAKVSSLESSEIVKIVKIRKALRQYAEEYDAFLKDTQEKFKPENFEQLQEKLQKWNDLSEEEKINTNKEIKIYEIKINLAVGEELEKEIEVALEKLTEESLTRLLKHNDWQLSKLDELQPIV